MNQVQRICKSFSVFYISSNRVDLVTLMLISIEYTHGHKIPLARVHFQDYTHHTFQRQTPNNSSSFRCMLKFNKLYLNTMCVYITVFLYMHLDQCFWNTFDRGTKKWLKNLGGPLALQLLDEQDAWDLFTGAGGGASRKSFLAGHFHTSAGHPHLCGPSTQPYFTNTTSKYKFLFSLLTLKNASQVLAGQLGPPEQALAGHNVWLGGPFLASGPLFEKHLFRLSGGKYLFILSWRKGEKRWFWCGAIRWVKRTLEDK